VQLGSAVIRLSSNTGFSFLNLDDNTVQNQGYAAPASQNVTIAGNTRTVTFVLSANPLEVVTASLPAGANGAFYSQSLQASGGQPPYRWSIPGYSASPPANLSLSTNGVLSGTPASAGNFMFFVRVTDGVLNTADSPGPLSLAIVNPQPVLSSPSWFTNRFQMRLTGVPGQNYTLQMSSNLQPNSWTTLYATNRAGTNSFLLADPNATNGQRSYRILVGP